MRNRLSLLLGEFADSDKSVDELLTEWSSAGLLGSTAWCDVGGGSNKRPQVKVNVQGSVVVQDLFELLTSRIWEQISVVAIRQSRLSSLSQHRFDEEARLLNLVEESFSAHRELEFQSFTVSIAEKEGMVFRAFSPQWKLHLVHEPVVRIDGAVASQPMWDDHRHLLVSLLAIAMSGGFVWQHGALAPSMEDPVSGSHRPLRMGRAFVRVVSAGRLTDEILAGAFPKSGPWSIPTDVPNALAVPPGTMMSDHVVGALKTAGGFTLRPVIHPRGESSKQIGLWQGVQLFLREFNKALRSIPASLVVRIKSEIEDFVQRATFGEGSSLLLKFDPASDLIDFDEFRSVISSLKLGYEIDPVGDPEPWNLLQAVALGAVDGGRFPDVVPVPTSASSRLVYTDPEAIGPAPDSESFFVTPFEGALLGIPEDHLEISAMDVTRATEVQLHLKGVSESLEVKPQSSADTTVSISPIVVTQEGAVREGRRAKKRRIRREKRALKRAKRRERRKARSESRKLKKQNKKSKSDQDNPPANPTDHGASIEDPDSSSGMTEQKLSSSGSIQDEAVRHRPSHPEFDPTEYVALTVFYQGSRSELQEEFKDENSRYEAALKTYEKIDGQWSQEKSCDHCGTSFDHGVLYLHEPTQKVVHVGRICAKKALPGTNDNDVLEVRLLDLEQRFSEWIKARSGSLLWRVGDSIVKSAIQAREDLASALEFLSTRPTITDTASVARQKFGKFTRRGLTAFVLILGAAVASIIFTPIPLLIAVLIVTSYLSGYVIRMVTLAREIVKMQFRMKRVEDEFERAFRIARHSVEEVVRLGSMNEQFVDWQAVIRDLVHQPFGKDIAFGTSLKGIEEVSRPPAMILGKSRPDDKQKMQLFLNARRQTIHGGWLTEVLDVMKQEWKDDYENSRLTTPADNILPEADNSPAGSIVGKRPLSDDDVYYPRTDFRRRVMDGDLQRRIVGQKAEQVAVDLRMTTLDRLLARVEVTGLGSALSGQTVDEFLAGLSDSNLMPVGFPPDLISDKYPNHRLFGPELLLPAPGENAMQTTRIQVEPGAEMTAAAWRIELSGPIHPLEILRGFENDIEVSQGERDQGIADYGTSPV